MTRTRRRDQHHLRVTTGTTLLFLCVLIVAGGLGLGILRHSPAGFATLWPQTGVAVGGLLFWGWRFWPAVWVAGTLVSLTAHGFPVAAIMGAGDAASALLAWLLLSRSGRVAPALHRRADVIRFICLGALVGTIPSPTIGVGVQYVSGLLHGPAHAAAYWGTWWAGNIAGVLLVTPPMLLWRRAWFSDLRASGRLGEAGIVFGTLALVTVSASMTDSRVAVVLHAMLPLPLLLWASLRLGALGASCAALMVASGGVLALLAHSTTAGDLAAASSHQWRLWAFNVMFAGTALLVTTLERERAAAEQTLRAREAQYRAIVENGSLMFCRFRPDGVLTFLNDTCCRLLGVERGAVIGRSVADGTGGAVPLLSAVFHRAHQTGDEPGTEPHTAVTNAGGQWTRWHYREAVDEVTGAIEVEAVGRDVTAEHAAAAEREALAVRNRALLAALGDVVYDWDAERDRFEWEGDVERVLGWPTDSVAVSLEAWAVHVHPDDRFAMLDGIDRAARDHTVYDVEYRFARQDGTWAWLHDRAIAFVEGRRVTRMIGVLRDVTARKRDEQALRESEMRFRMAAELGSDLIYEWDVEANRVIRSGRVAEMFGDVRGASDAPMEQWAQLIHPEDRARTLTAVEDHLAHGTPYQVQYRVIHPEGVRTWSDRASAVRDDQGRPVRWFGVTRDVTTQVRLEEQLRQSQKMESVGLLAGGVAHDFNNLLQVIQGHTLLAQEDGLPEAERQASLQQVSQASDRAASLTRQLLAFGRRQPMQLASTDLAELVTQLLKMVRRLIGEHIEVDFSAAAGTIAVRCDRAQIEQVLLNLCVNGRDAMPRGGRLAIAVDEHRVHRSETFLRPGLKEGHYARLRVTDTGTGMDEVTRRRVFEPFFTTKAEGYGTGLGLAVAYGVIKQHDGYIDAESTPGTGSTFTVLLPFHADTTVVASPLVTPPRGDATGHEMILLAEDEATVRALGEQILRKAGYRVVTAADGADALEVFEAHEGEIALAILDAVMPRLSGQEVARAIGRRRPTLPVLLCSGYPGSAPEILLPDGTAFLQKPWRPQQLLGHVRRMLDAPVSDISNTELPQSIN